MAIERDGGSTGRGLLFLHLERSGSARGWRLYVKLAATTVPCRSIESYLSMGNNMVARKAEEEERLRSANTREKQTQNTVRGGRGEREVEPPNMRLGSLV